MNQIKIKLLLLMLICFPGSALTDTPATVQVAYAVLQEIAPNAWYSGTIIGKERAHLAIEVAGRISAILEVGDQVDQGEIVAQIDPKPLTLELKTIEAEAASTKAQLNFYQKESKRLAALIKQSHIAKNRFDETIARRDELAGRLATIQARVAQAQDRLARTVSYSPFAGVVAERFKARGEYVAAGTAVLHLVNTAALEVQLRIPHRLLSYIKPKMQLTVTDTAGGSVAAELATLVPVADTLSRLYELRLKLPPKHGWMPGHDVRVAVPAGAAHRAVLVSQDALVIRHQGNSLFRVSEHNTAEQIAVETGLSQGNLIEIITGIKSGDRIVIRGNELLRPGQKVIIQQSTN